MGCLLGIDLGTSSVKVLITDFVGNTIAFSQVGYEISIPKYGWAEQDPEVWWGATVKALRLALYESGVEAAKISGIGFSGQMHGLVAIDKEFKAIRPAIIWADQRTQNQVEEIYNIIGKNQIAKLTLNPLATGFLIASLLWMKQNEQDYFNRINKVILPKDYIRYKLTGMIGTDTTDASATLAFNTCEKKWCEEIILSLGLNINIFPKLGEPYDIAGQVTHSAAYETGLNINTPVVFGGADQPMQAVGNGIVEPGLVASNIGTASQLSTPIEKPLYDIKLRTNTFCHAQKNMWNIQGSSLNGGLALKWLKDKVLKVDDFKMFDEEAMSVDAGSEGLIFLPYLTGERTPHFDPAARGVFFGLTLKQERKHLIRAVMEGVVYSLRDSLEIFKSLNIKVEKVVASGGGAKSKVWLQMQADILKNPVYTTNIKEQACLGAAIMAGVGVGVYKTIHEACSTIIKISNDVTLPKKQNVEIYDRQYEVFKEIYLRNSDLFRKI